LPDRHDHHPNRPPEIDHAFTAQQSFASKDKRSGHGHSTWLPTNGVPTDASGLEGIIESTLNAANPWTCTKVNFDIPYARRGQEGVSYPQFDIEGSCAVPSHRDVWTSRDRRIRKGASYCRHLMSSIGRPINTLGEMLRQTRTCLLLILLGILTIIGSLVPALWCSIARNDMSGGFALAQYVLGVGVLVVGSVVAIHSRTCTCWQ